MAREFQLGFKIKADGGDQAAKEVARMEQALKQVREENAQVARTAAKLKDAYNLNDKEVAEVAKRMEELAEETRKAEAEAANLDKGLAAIAGGAGALGAGIGALFAKGMAAAADYDRTLFAVEKQIESTGGSVGLTAEQLQAFANDLGNATLTSEEAVLRASRALLSFRSVTGDTFTRTITVAQDLAEVMGGDLESNIVQIGKALEDPVNGLSALSRSGTQFTDQQKELIKSLVESGDQMGAQQVILEELERQYGGAGIAAAAGLAGSLDTLGEEMNDLTRAFGNFAQQGAKPVVDAAILLLNSFNSLPAPIQTALIASTAFVGVLATAVAAVAAYNLANGKKILTETLAAAAQVKSTIATGADIAVTQAATVAKNALAIATGKATAAQIASAKALAGGALTLGLFAGAVASVALVVDTFNKVDAAAAKTREATKSVEAALEKLGSVGQGTGADIGSGLAEADQNLAQLKEGLGGIQNALDRVRGIIPGIPTAAEAASNRSQIAFNELVSSTDDVRLAAAQVAVDLEKGVSIDPAKVAATTQAIDAAVAALKAQQPVTAEDIARRDAQVAGLESYRTRIAETTAGTVAMGDATGGLTDKIKDLDQALKDTIAGIDLTKLQAQARILEQLTRGEITQDQADTQLANVESLTLEDRLKAQRENLNNLRELRAEAEEGSAQALELDQKITESETALAQTRISLARQTVDEKKKAEEEATEAAVEAAKKRGDALKAERDAAKRLAEEQFGDRQRQEGQTFSKSQAREAEAFQRGQQDNAKAFQKTQQADQEAFAKSQAAEAKAFQKTQQADQEAFAKSQAAEAKAFQKSQQAEAKAFQEAQQAAAKAFQKSLDAERQKGNREFDVLTSEVERRVQLQQAASEQERDALKAQFAEEDKQLKERRKIEKEVLAERGKILGQRQEEIGLGPLEQAKADFEAGLQARAEAFQNAQQAEAEAFQAKQQAEAEAFAEAQKARDVEFKDQQEAEAEAFQEAQREADRTFREEQQAQAEAFADAQKAKEKAFQEQQQAAQQAFADQQREADRAFKEQQRQLDKQNAEQIAAILAAAKPAGATPRRDGGPVRAGQTYLVGEVGPELIVPSRSGYVLTAKETAALERSLNLVAPALSVASPSGNVEGQLNAILKTLQRAAKRPINAPQNNTFINEPNPAAATAELRLAELRQRVRGGAL